MATHTRKPELSDEQYAQLRDGFPAAVSALHRRCAAEIGDDAIDDYVAMGWLEWSAGALKVTKAGENLSYASQGRPTD